MKKLLIFITCIASLWLSGCSSSRFHLVHKLDVQQGNVVTQEELNKLEPGMTRRQVQYIMGSPMIADVFHQDRWDYIYLMQPGYGKPSSDHVTLYFEGDVLQRVEGSMHPQDVGADAPASSHQVTVVVPPKERVPPGLLTRLWYWITFRTPGET
jgi:outer membrane protein assembly factor BamE